MPECNGLGEIYSFDPAQLIPDPSRSFQQGCVELVGTWKEMGRWRRHIYRGVAEHLERKYGLEAGTAWRPLGRNSIPRIAQALLYGTGDEHITFTWRVGHFRAQVGRRVRGNHSQAPLPVSGHGKPHAAPHAGEVHERDRLHRCGGERLNAQARAVKLTTQSPRFAESPSRSLPEVSALAISEAEEFFSNLVLDATRQTIAAEALKEIRGRLRFLKNVGLEYLSLNRTAPTLSGGEMQRIRLAGQIGCGLVGVLYILDEPSIGLHARDNDRLLETLAQLRDQGNTVIIVEHERIRCGPPTTWSISAPVPASAAAKWSRRGPSSK